MSPVKLYRAPHRGAEGAGVAVVWECVEDVSDFDGAMDAITEGGRAFMFRLARGKERSVWSVVAGRPYEIAPAEWLTYADNALRQQKRDWIETIECMSSTCAPFAVKCLALNGNLKVAVAITSTVARMVYLRCRWGWKYFPETVEASLATSPFAALDMADAFVRGESADVSACETMADNLRDTANNLNWRDRDYALNRALFAVADCVNTVGSPDCANTSLLNAISADDSWVRRGSGVANLDIAGEVRLRITPEMIFDVMVKREEILQWVETR